MVFELLSGGVFGPKELFPSRAIVAVGNQGQIAEGDGLDYCISVRRVDEPGIGMWCREIPRVRIGAAIRSPDLALLEGVPQAELARGYLGDQDPGELLPHFDQILFSESGDLWVRTYDQALADIHPGIVVWRPDLAPPYRHWEVFGSDGGLVRRVRLPYSFQPRVISDDGVFGLWPLETGEITIGRASLEEVRSDSSTAGNGL